MPDTLGVPPVDGKRPARGVRAIVTVINAVVEARDPLHPGEAERAHPIVKGLLQAHRAIEVHQADRPAIGHKEASPLKVVATRHPEPKDAAR